MLHLTMNSGHRRVSRRSEVNDAVIEKMRPLVRVGSHDLGSVCSVAAGYRLVVYEGDGYHASLQSDLATCVEIGVAWSEESDEYAWSVLAMMYEGLLKEHAPVRPKSLPWVAAIVFGLDPCLDWAGDFERCLAWTVIQERTKP